MAGFFGLFGKKKKNTDDSSPAVPKSKENKEAFFLDSDSAKTWGDIEFMRNPKVIKRSFPKTLKGKIEDSVKSVSSMEVTSDEGKAIVSNSPEIASNEGASDRKRTDSSLDAFRQMAKDIRK